MMSESATVDYSKLDPEKLQKLIDKLDESLKLNEQTAHKTRQLRWALTKQMRLNQPIFWLWDKRGNILAKIFNEYCDEYELVFGKKHPSRYGNMIEDSKAWAMWEQKRWQEAQAKRRAP